MGEGDMDRKEIARKHGLIDYMKLSEVMAYASCSERFIMDEIKRKNLRAYKPVRELLFDPKDVHAWFRKKIKSA